MRDSLNGLIQLGTEIGRTRKQFKILLNVDQGQGAEPIIRRLQWLGRKVAQRFQFTFRSLHLKLRLRKEICLRSRYGFRIILDPTKEVDRRFYLGGFERQVLDLFVSMLNEGMVVVDVGANIGVYTLAARARVGTTGSVHAFEPAQWAFGQLQRNVTLNRYANVALMNVGLSDTRGNATLHICNDDAYNSLGALPMDVIVSSRLIEVTTIDSYVKQNNLNSVDVIKIDTEGADYLVLRGAHDTIERFSPVLFFEYNRIVRGFSFPVSNIETYLISLGYLLYYVTGEWLAPFNGETCNATEVVALRSTKPKV